MDKNFFKLYNGPYGPQAGNERLRIMGGILESVMRNPADIAACYGEEDFVVLLTNTPSEGAQQIALEIQKYLA